MKLTCSKCRHGIEIPSEVLHSPEPRVECPSCGARFRLKPKSGAPALPHVQTGSDLAGQTTPGVRSSISPHSGVSPSSATQPPPPPGAPLDGEAPTQVSTGASLGRRQAAPPAFDEGDLVAGRYRIRRFLAQGGMGEVYEAEDVELLQEVALKTVSAAMGDEPAVIERFKREIALARRVTHPNVCRIFDLGTHQPAPSEVVPHPEPIVFLTMELLRGETLSALLRRRDRLTPDESLHLLRQMASALGAAHASSVVHRDFKSENVFLVPDDGGDQVGDARQSRAVITDFGVARGAAGDAFAAQVTGLGIVGTPSYMAPEQVENAPEITAAADIYALGVVLYEMTTGRLPFESDNPLTVAVKRLKEEPKPPHVHVPDLPPVWERTILRCLARRPTDRFQTADEVVASFDAPARRPPTTSSQPVPTAPRPQTERATAHRSAAQQAPQRPAPATIAGAAAATPEGPPKRTRWLAGVLFLVVVFAGALWWINSQVLQERVKIRPAVAVIGLDNVTGRDDASWIDTAVAEMLANELARSSELRTVSGERIAAARREIAIPRMIEPSGEALGRLRTLLGTDYVIGGSYVALPGDAGELRLDLKLYDAALGQSVDSFSGTGTMGDLLSMVSTLGTEMRSALDAGSGAGGEAGLPSDPEAARLYAEALDDLRQFEAEAARDKLQRALAVEPSNPMLHAALASAWDALGFTERATESARDAFERSGELPLEDRLLIEARLREAEGDWAAAFDAYRQLFESFPDELDYGLGLVDAQIAGGDAEGALDNLARLRLLPEPLNEDPRIDLAEAEAAARLSKLEQQAQAATRAAARAEAAQASLLLARALLAGAQADRLLGRAAEAAPAIERAGELYRQLDHGPGRAEALTAAANLRFDQGELDEAADGYQQAEAMYRELGDRSGVAASLNNLAVVRKRQGALDEAEALYRENEAIAREVGDERGEVLAINNRAVLLVDRDRLVEAKTMFEGSLDAWEGIGGGAGRAYALNNLAEVARLQARLDDAREMHREAISIRRQANLQRDLAGSLANLGTLQVDAGALDDAQTTFTDAEAAAEAADDPTARADVLFGLGELRRRRGEQQAAIDTHRDALDRRQSLDQTARIARSRIALARLLLEVDPEEAEDLARQAWTSSQGDGRPADEARAAAVLIEALIALDAGPDAEDVFDSVQAIRDETTQPAVRIEVGMAEARLLHWRGDRRRAVDRLAELDREARSLGLVALAGDIRRTADVLGAAG